MGRPQLRCLLDTHALLWWLTDDKRLSPAARNCIAHIDNEVLVSAATAWEIATKHRLGKLGLGDAIVQRYTILVAEQGFIRLPISEAHALRAGSWPHAHRDPFDRMLAAQSEIERLPLISIDEVFAEFAIERIW